VFWWYWSVRQRLMLLAAVLLPVVGFFSFHALLGGSSPETSTTVEQQQQDLPVADAPEPESLVLSSDDSRSAASAFPKTFGEFGAGAIQTRNMIFPGMRYDEYSVYLFFRTVSESDAQIPVAAPVTTLAPEDAQDVSSPETSVPASFVGTTVETTREALRWHFTERGGVARPIESRAGVELFVIGLEGSRGFQGTLRFQEVSGGVVVRGVVKEIPANEANDAIAETQAPASGVAPAPIGQDGTSSEGVSSTVPVTTVP